MKVFLSWSGEYSRAAATAFNEFLSWVFFQDIKTWMSTGIEAGKKWDGDIAMGLEGADYGILFLTRLNQARPWIMFEAGAIAKRVKNARVVPYLLDGMAERDMEAGPLTSYHAKTATLRDTYDVFMSVNHLIDRPLEEARLKLLFSKFWPDFERRLSNIPKETDKVPPRPEEDMMGEVLQLVRQIHNLSPARVGEVDWNEIPDHILEQQAEEYEAKEEYRREREAEEASAYEEILAEEKQEADALAETSAPPK